MDNVTLSDIAKIAGYSVNTVSHALRDMPDISKETKKHIKKIADELGYIPNTFASALRDGKTKTVAIILGDISNPYFAAIIKELEYQLRKHDYNAFILNTNENQDIEREAIYSAISKGVEGIILCPVQQSKDNIELIESKKIPYVLFGRHFGESSNSVVCDDINGGKIAALHLFKENKKDILFLNGPSYISSANERLQGIQDAYREAGIPVSKLSVAEIDIIDDNKAVLDCLKKHSHCNGIICFSDIIAMQACRHLNEMDRKVPDDVSVIGFDDISSQFYSTTMLSSVTSSKRKTASQAVKILLEYISGVNTTPKNIVISTKLTLRDTTINDL